MSASPRSASATSMSSGLEPARVLVWDRRGVLAPEFARDREALLCRPPPPPPPRYGEPGCWVWLSLWKVSMLSTELVLRSRRWARLEGERCDDRAMLAASLRRPTRSLLSVLLARMRLPSWRAMPTSA